MCAGKGNVITVHRKAHLGNKFTSRVNRERLSNLNSIVLESQGMAKACVQKTQLPTRAGSQRAASRAGQSGRSNNTMLLGDKKTE